MQFGKTLSTDKSFLCSGTAASFQTVAFLPPENFQLYPYGGTHGRFLFPRPCPLAVKSRERFTSPPVLPPGSSANVRRCSHHPMKPPLSVLRFAAMLPVATGTFPGLAAVIRNRRNTGTGRWAFFQLPGRNGDDGHPLQGDGENLSSEPPDAESAACALWLPPFQ